MRQTGQTARWARWSAAVCGAATAALAVTASAQPAGTMALPDEAIRQADLALEADLARQAALLAGPRVGTDGAPVSSTAVLGLVFTRNMWVAVLRQRASTLEQIRRMEPAEKAELLDTLRPRALALHSAYVNMVTSRGRALSSSGGERARYERLMGEAERLEQSGDTAGAADVRARAERSPWGGFESRRATFFGLLEQDALQSLLGLYTDNWIFPNRYFFQTLVQRAYSLSWARRQEEMLADFDSVLDANIAKLRGLADRAEAIASFADLLEYAGPKYARIHQMGTAMSEATGMTLPALLMYPLPDIGRSFALADQFGDTVRETLVAIVSVGSMVFPVVGAFVNLGLAAYEVTVEGGQYVVQWVRATEARQTATATGQGHVLTEIEKSEAQGGRVVLTVLQLGSAIPLFGQAARAQRGLGGRVAGPAGIDASPATMPWVQRGAQRARDLGVPEDAVAAALKSAMADNVPGNVFAAQLTQIGRLDELMRAARAAGVPEAEIAAMLSAARAQATIGALSQDLVTGLQRATLNRRGITVVVDLAHRLVDGRTNALIDDAPLEALLTYFRNEPPASVIRTDLVKAFDLRARLRAMREGQRASWTAQEIDRLQKILGHPDLDRLYAFFSDEGALIRLFDDDIIDTGRRFLAAENRRDLAIGRAVLPPAPGTRVTSGVATGPPGAIDAITGEIVTGTAAATVATGAFPRPVEAREVTAPGTDSIFEPLSLPVERPRAGDAAAGSRPLTTFDLEQAALDHARAAFGQRTVSWSTSAQPDGSVVVTSPDGLSAVVAWPGDEQGVPHARLETRTRRGRFIDHVRTVRGVRLEWSEPAPDGLNLGPSTGLPTGSPAIPPRGAPGRDGGGGTSAMPAGGGTPGGVGSTVRPGESTTPDQTSAGPQGTTTPSGTGLLPEHVGGAMTPVRGENAWFPKPRPTGEPTFTGWPVRFNSALVASARSDTGVQFAGATTDGTVIEVPGRQAGGHASRAGTPRPERLGAFWSIAAPSRGFAEPLAIVAARPARSSTPAGVSNQAGRLPPDAPLTVYVTSLGESSGEAFTMTFVNESRDAVTLDTDLLVLEPVAGVTSREVEKALARHPSDAGRKTATVVAYCLEHLKDPPRLGMAFRIADDAAQRRFAPYRHIMQASRQLHQAGRLVADGGNPTSYFHSIRQWAVWTREQEFDEGTFGDSFVEHTRRNVEAAGRQWTAAFEQAARRLVPGRWQAIQVVLLEALRLERGETGEVR